MSPNPISAGVIVVRRVDGEWRFLLLRAFQYWDFPKGLVEEGEASLEAAMREVQEETSLTGLDFRWGHERRDTAPYGKYRKIARYYVAESAQGEVTLPVSEELGRPEHEEFRWTTLDEAYDLVSPRVQRVLDWVVDILGQET